MRQTGVWLRRAALLLLLAVLTVAALTARIVARGESALESSDAAFDAGDLRKSTLFARRAAVLYVPGAPHVSAAYDRLGAIALGAESAGDLDVARAAWEAMRGAALETRHARTPRASELERADRNIARLSALRAAPDRRPRERDRQAQLLAQSDAPELRPVILLFSGLLLAAAGLACLALRGVGRDGRLSARWAAWGMALTLAGAACWTLAVYTA